MEKARQLRADSEFYANHYGLGLAMFCKHCGRKFHYKSKGRGLCYGCHDKPKIRRRYDYTGPNGKRCPIDDREWGRLRESCPLQSRCIPSNNWWRVRLSDRACPKMLCREKSSSPSSLIKLPTTHTDVAAALVADSTASLAEWAFVSEGKLRQLRDTFICG